ncbi:MAG: hypothetical protein ACRELV_09235 [Longimicrobiales bacterium]
MTGRPAGRPVVSMPSRIFLLSPASCGGKRATMLLRDAATFELARSLRSPAGAPLGEVFAFLSGLYFRGKLSYARAFARPPGGAPGALIITSDRGLRPPETRVRVDDLHGFAAVPIDVGEPRYREPLLASLAALCARIPGDCEIVLLGSIATPKYIEPISLAVGSRLRVPVEFAGRGDMSRGGLLLRRVDAGSELDYATIDSTPRRGPRPPPRRRRRPPASSGGEVADAG